MEQRKETVTMSTAYLLFIPLPEDRADLGEALARSAACFLEAQGETAERIDLGSFRREGRATAELLTLVKFAVEGDAAGDGARALEGVLRQTLKATRVVAGDVRVFVSEAEQTP
jgi:hypothetical protein